MNPALIHKTTGEPSSVVFDNPHSARTETWLWDGPIDRLLAGVPETGAVVLETTIPRTTIDVNRKLYEMNPELIAGDWECCITANVRKGLGLIPSEVRYIDGTLRHAFSRHSRLSLQALKDRVQNNYVPYYQALKSLMTEARDHHSVAIHFNIHSTPRLDAPQDHDIILGDLYGRSASPHLLAFATRFIEKSGFRVGINAPYPGGALIRSTGRPHQGFHSLQLEIARDLFMDQNTLEYREAGGKALRDMLTELAHALKDFTKDYARILRAPAP